MKLLSGGLSLQLELGLVVAPDVGTGVEACAGLAVGTGEAYGDAGAPDEDTGVTLDAGLTVDTGDV